MCRIVSAFVMTSAIGIASIQTPARTTLDRTALDQALRLARGSETERRQFHAAYQIPTADPAVEQLEVITEYRRMVLIIEERIATGTWSYAVSAYTAENAIAPWRNRLTVRTRIRFHPQNAYPRPPEFYLYVGDLPTRLSPLKTEMVPQYAGGSRAGSGTLVRGVVEGIFDATAVAQRRLPITLLGPDALAVRNTIDFGSLR